MNVEIGGGKIPEPGWQNLDPLHGVGEWQRRIQDGIPAPDGSVARVRARHVVEHIPAGQQRIDMFNEVHRVLVSGGEFEIWLPLAFVNDQINASFGPWSDPTHVSYWHYPGSFHYFDGLLSANADYGIRLWAHLDPGRCNIADWNNALVTMVKP